MSDISNIEFEEVSEAENAQLQGWLAEYYAERALRRADVDAADMPGSASDAGEWDVSRQDEEDTEFAPGDVRLLNPTLPGGADRLFYILIVRPEGDGHWLCMPFSPYSTPAIPGEVATGLDDPGMRVVSPWNAAALPEAVIAASWRAGRAPDSVLNSCIVAHEAGPRSWRFVPRWSEARGPRVVHPLDPRHDYMAEERRIMAGLSGYGSAGTVEGDVADVTLYPDAGSEEHLMAAETGRPYGSVASFEVENRPLFLNFWTGSRAQLLVRVVDEQECPSVLLDGWRLVGPRGIVSPRLATGCLTVPRTYLRDEIKLQGPDGELIQLTRCA